MSSRIWSRHFQTRLLPLYLTMTALLVALPVAASAAARSLSAVPTQASQAPSDRDNDGIADSADACPDLQERGSANGCPDGDKDSDGDGIADLRDPCPYDAPKPIADSAHPGCPTPFLLTYTYARTDSVLNGRPKNKYPAQLLWRGFLTPRSITISASVSAATAKAARLSSRQLWSRTTVLRARYSGREEFAMGKATPAVQRKLGRLEDFRFTLSWDVTLSNGQHRKLSRTATFFGGSEKIYFYGRPSRGAEEG